MINDRTPLSKDVIETAMEREVSLNPATDLRFEVAKCDAPGKCQSDLKEFPSF